MSGEPDKIGLDNVGLAFGLVAAAGLSTAVGAAAVFCESVVQLAAKPVLAAALGFSAGVMLYVSFIEIVSKGIGAFALDGKTDQEAYVWATFCFFAGMLMFRALSMLVHTLDKDHDSAEQHFVDKASDGWGGVELEMPVQQPMEPRSIQAQPTHGDATPRSVEVSQGQPNNEAQQLNRMGLNTAIAISIHNFPEGLATFVATLADPAVGLTLAVAISIHNIPEGLCVALPIYYASGSRVKGFLWGLLSGASEPVGALIGYAIIRSTGDDLNQVVYGVLFSVVGGMMVMIVISELLPTAFHYDPQDKRVTNSVVLGMMVMAASLCLFLF